MTFGQDPEKFPPPRAPKVCLETWKLPADGLPKIINKGAWQELLGEDGHVKALGP